MAKKRATIKDVAEKAGVTIGTVSHVINHTARISDQTVRRVRQAIRDLDYVPNSAARMIRQKERNLVGILIPKLTNSFYSLITSTFMDEADKENETVLIVSYEYSLEQERRALYSLMQNNVGTIIIAGGSGDEEYIQDLLERGLQVILADRWSDMPDVSCAGYENQAVLSDIIGALKGRGYASIGFLSEPLALSNLQERFEGYRKALKEYGYAFREDHVFISDRFRLNHAENGYLYTRDLLKSHGRDELPEAFIVTSDLIAIGAMRAMREAGFCVPGDFGVVGFDDLEISAYMQPALSTVRQDRVRLGRELWRMTKSLRAGGPAEKLRLAQKLVIRESC